MSETEAIKTMLEIYAETDKPVTQKFYQGLCVKAKRIIEQLQSQLTIADKQILDYEQTEAAVCPEDIGVVEYVKSLLGKLTTAKEENRWIPVSEKLPNKTKDDLRPQVLVFDGESISVALWRHYDLGWDFETDRGKPTHWCPVYESEG